MCQPQLKKMVQNGSERDGSTNQDKPKELEL